MTPIKRTLLAIAAFVTLALGSLIYFIANWDSSTAGPIGGLTAQPTQHASLFSDSKNPGVWGSAAVLSSPHAGRMT
ncbi:MAG: hypothetical protein ABJ263_11065 [Tateyamaria sp.]|uniref:hypothetical protein n=1 Tax=Tateyamaria sp. TaxID=1929288 RepID=UPI003280C27E